MKRDRFDMSAGAMLLGAGLAYLAPPQTLTALLLPVAAHELGHLLMIGLLGLRLRSFRWELKGFCMDYVGSTSCLGHVLIALAGPLAGLCYAWAASWAGNRYGVEWLWLSAGVSLLLTVYNLLPALPLDGGRILLHLSCAALGDRRGRKVTEAAGVGVGVLLLAPGIWLLTEGVGAALLAAAIWLLFCQESARGLVKKREII